MKPKTRMAGIRATAGARANTHLSAALGMIDSFWTNLIPSATSWRTPWKRPASIGPSLACMWAMTLCSMYPTRSGKVRKMARTASTLTGISTQ